MLTPTTGGSDEATTARRGAAGPRPVRHRGPWRRRGDPGTGPVGRTAGRWTGTPTGPVSASGTITLAW